MRKLIFLIVLIGLAAAVIIFSKRISSGILVKQVPAVDPVYAQNYKDFSKQFNRLTGVWVNTGEDKVTQEELRATQGKNVSNSVWDGQQIKLFGARNEVLGFNVILESAHEDITGLKVKFDRMEGPDGFVIGSKKISKQDVFDYVGRNIELFVIRYLQIKGVGRMLYMPDYDERHVPERLRLPYTLPKGTSHGKFEDRPGANKFYPDIAVPIEAVGQVRIEQGHNQSIWVDVYIPKDAPAGMYHGTITVDEAGRNSFDIPVELEVLDFALPDEQSAKTMLYYSGEDIYDRYFGKRHPDWKKVSYADQQWLGRVWMNHHKLAHRHKISLIDEGMGIEPDRTDKWFSEHALRWISVFNGSAFTPENGYDGPGVGISSGVYSIGTYGAWKRQWNQDNKHDLWKMSDLWVQWFENYAPQVEYFVYLHDEPGKDMFEKIERWAKWIDENPGPGQRLKTLVATGLVRNQEYMPSVDIAFTGWGDKAVWQPVVEKMLADGKEYWAYNGKRPSRGSFATEDDGVSLRVNGWIQYKHKVGRWFYWHGTCYKNPSHVNLETNVFQSAWTFGRRNEKAHAKYGETGNNYSNGDGVLLYPGTEKRYPEENYGLDGPIASLRLKFWRRGLQDHDYLTMAARYDPEAVDALVEKMIPRVLWEVGVTNPKDPTYVHADISWSIDPDVWEAARRELAEIILKGQTNGLAD